MHENRLQQAVLTGSAALRRPVDGCRCPACAPCSTATPDHPDPDGPPAWCAPSGLLLPGLLRIDGDPREAGDRPAPGVPAPARLRTRRPEAPGETGARWLAAGERAEFGPVRVAALPAGRADGTPDPERVVLVLGDGPLTLVWAAGGGPLPEVTVEALQDAGLEAAVLEAGGRELGLAHQVARLDRVRALAAGALLVAAGLPDTGPLPRRFARAAAGWGVRVLPDRSRLWPARPDPDPDPDPDENDHPLGSIHPAPAHRLRPCPAPPRRTVVLGAAGSGKSALAESLLAALPEVVYAATGPQPDSNDGSWAARVERHRRRRPTWWQTVEDPDLIALLRSPGPPLLVDSLGSWLTGRLDGAGCWADRPGWAAQVDRQIGDLVTAWRQAARPVVAVTEEVGWGVVPATASGGRFRDLLARLNRLVCDQTERVLLVVAGRMVDLDAAPWGGPDPQPKGYG